MEETPNEDGSSHEQEPERLVAPKCTALLDAVLLLGDLLFVRLDTAFNHGGSYGVACAPDAPVYHASV